VRLLLATQTSSKFRLVPILQCQQSRYNSFLLSLVSSSTNCWFAVTSALTLPPPPSLHRFCTIPSQPRKRTRSAWFNTWETYYFFLRLEHLSIRMVSLTRQRLLPCQRCHQFRCISLLIAILKMKFGAPNASLQMNQARSSIPILMFSIHSTDSSLFITVPQLPQFLSHTSWLTNLALLAVHLLSPLKSLQRIFHP
jgi:hypothetical protein